MSVTADVKAAKAPAIVVYMAIGVVLGATLLYAPMNRLVTWAKAKFFHRAA